MLYIAGKKVHAQLINYRPAEKLVFLFAITTPPSRIRSTPPLTQGESFLFDKLQFHTQIHHISNNFDLCYITISASNIYLYC